MNISEILPARMCKTIRDQYTKDSDTAWFFGIECDATGSFETIVFTQKDRLPASFSVDLVLIYLPEQAVLRAQARELYEQDIPVRMVFIDYNATLISFDEESYHSVALEDVTAIFHPGGALEQSIQHYTMRSGQVDMATRITANFNDGGVTQIEAGTGVGKSFAYLVPAVYFATLNDTRILISTASIALQQQLVAKDIPVILKTLQSNISVAVVKGMQNYLCIDKLHQQEDFFEYFDKNTRARLRDWATNTETGDRIDIPFPITSDDWNSFAADNDHCSVHNCPHTTRCFLKRAREKAQQARILVANHHLMLIDRDIRSLSDESVGIIPRYSHIIVDEAHKLSEIARSVFSTVVSSRSVMRIAQRIYHTSKKRLLHTLLAERGSKTLQGQKATAFIQKMYTLVERLSGYTQDLDACINQEIATSSDTIPNGMKQELLLGAFSGVSAYKKTCADICATVKELVSGLQSVRNYVEETSEIKEHIMYRFMQTIHRLNELHSFFTKLYTHDVDDTLVQFVQQHDALIYMWNIPLGLQDQLHEKLLVPLRSLVFTSATLEKSEAVHTWQEYLSVEEKQVHRVSSAFHYKDQQLLAIPNDAPPVKYDTDRYIRYLVDLVVALAKISKGSMLLLFTSYAMMNKCDEQMRKKGIADSFTLLKQGDLSRQYLLEQFKADTTSILLGTDSFWEGVDVPGEALRILVVARLPFKVPSGVYAQARDAYLRSQGKNPFTEIHIPEAAQKLKQGIGRLIRSESDYGAVIVSDTRILKWKKSFIDILPRSQHSMDSTAGILKEVEAFFASFS